MKNYRIKILVFVSIALLISTFVLSWMYFTNSAPIRVANEYLSALQKNDFIQAYSLLSNNSKKYVDFSSYEQAHLSREKSTFNDLILKTKTSDHIVVSWKNSQGNDITEKSLALVQEQGNWKIVYFGTLLSKLHDLGTEAPLEEQLKILDQILEIAPWNEKTVVLKTMIRVQQISDKDAQIKLLDETLKIFPSNERTKEMKALILINRALDRIEQKRMDEALADLQEAKKLAPNDKKIQDLLSKFSVTSTPVVEPVAAWVEAFKKIVKNRKAIKEYSSGRDDDGPWWLYDFKFFQPDTVATLARIDGNPKAWWWEYSAVGISVTDLIPSEELEFLFEGSSNMKWYRIKNGEFKDSYIGTKPFPQNQTEIKLITSEYARLANEDELQPWLCTNGKVAGATPLDNDTMIFRCRELVRSMLKAPSTAEFQVSYDGKNSPLIYGNCNMEFKSWVEAQNPFGVPLRNSFVCTYNARTQKLQVRMNE